MRQLLTTGHRQPKLKKGVQCNVTYAILHNYAKRDSRLTAYGGIVLQRFEFVKVCMGRQRLCWKSQLFLYFVDKIYLPCCRVVFFVVFLAVETHKTISRRNRVRSACEAGKQQRIQHGNRVSRFYPQNIRIIDFSSKAVAFPYKPLQIQTVVTQYLHML